MPVGQQAAWSKTRITLASLVLVGAGVAGYQFLLRPVAPAKPAVAAETTAVQDIAMAVQPAAVRVAEPTVSPTTAQARTQTDVAAKPTEPAGQSQVTAAEVPQPAAPQPQTLTEPKPADVQSSTPALPNKVAPAETSPAETSHTSASFALPPGFSRIVLTDQMNNLQPGKAVGQQIAYPQIKRLYLFTELKDYAGQILRHRWYFRDTLHTEAVLTIEDSPWRTYSENWLLDDQRGPWRVEIVDQTQKVIFQYSFTYQ
jgi:hypothetical protein